MFGLSGVRTVWHVVWTDGRPDVMARSFGRLTGNWRFSNLQEESSDITLNSGIPDKTASLHTSDFVQTQNGANNTNKLPFWPFWDKNHLTCLEIHSRSK
jgi:hypothetical protein